MKKTLLYLSFAFITLFVKAQTITISPEPNPEIYYDFSKVQVETYIEETYTITTTSTTPINLSYVWGSSGLGISSCYNGVNIFTVESITNSISASSPGTLVIRFNPRSYDTKMSFQGKCITTGTSIGTQSYIADLKLSVNNSYNTTMNLKGEGVLEPTGIFKNESSFTNLSFYPNPTTNKVFLTETQNWFVLDSFGNELFSGNGDTIDLSQTENGIYFIKTIENNSTKIGRIIKQ